MKDWNIEYWPLEKVIPYDRNPRQNEDAVAATAESIRQFGFQQPLIVDKKGVLICGHTRREAAIRIGMTEVPVHVATDLTTKQVQAYRIADNKTAEIAEWNLDLLAIELGELEEFDFTTLGFDADELESILSGSGVLDELEENAFANHLEDQAEGFTVSLVFEKKYKERMDAYLEKNGKEPLVKLITEKICRSVGAK